MENPTSYSAPLNGAPPRPGNWLVPAILVTIFCCNVLGVVGVVYAARVDTKYLHGDYAGAAEDARQARLWTLIPVGISLVLWVLYALFFGAAVLSNLDQFNR
jgi:ABC-type Fe3+ transport system permease subunit